MARRKYFIDIETITISSDKGESFFGKRIWFFSTALSIILGLAIAVIFYHFFDSPSEKRLQQQIYTYQFQYYALNSRINSLQKNIAKLEDKDDNTYRIIYELPPVSPDMRKAGIGGAVQYSEFFNSKNTKIVGLSFRNIDLAIRKMLIQSGSFEEVKQAAYEKEKMLASIPTIMPVSRDRVRITSLFGWRKNPFNNNLRDFHSGIDFAGKPGTPIYATGDGVVVNNSRMLGYGIVVIINHGYGYKTLYGHLSKVNVKEGEKVKRGQVIGKLGRTGLATGPHLHYEVIKDGNRVNPMNNIANSISREEYNEIIKQAQSNQGK